jgi:hypothetical protein
LGFTKFEAIIILFMVNECEGFQRVEESAMSSGMSPPDVGEVSEVYLGNHDEDNILENGSQSASETSGQLAHIRRRHLRRYQGYFRYHRYKITGPGHPNLKLG